jgi:hypothetical protein
MRPLFFLPCRLSVFPPHSGQSQCNGSANPDLNTPKSSVASNRKTDSHACPPSQCRDQTKEHLTEIEVEKLAKSIQSTVRYAELAPGRFKNIWR